MNPTIEDRLKKRYAMLPPSGAAVIHREQLRQRGKGFTAEHDLRHRAGELAVAAACYTLAGQRQLQWGNASDPLPVPLLWPFEKEAWNPGATALESFAKAGAFLASQLDVLLEVSKQLAKIPSLEEPGKMIAVCPVHQMTQYVDCQGCRKAASENNRSVL